MTGTLCSMTTAEECFTNKTSRKTQKVFVNLLFLDCSISLWPCLSMQMQGIDKKDKQFNSWLLSPCETVTVILQKVKFQNYM